MGKGDEPPAPPNVTVPGMSKAEKRLIQEQQKLLRQMTRQSEKQFKFGFGNAKQDRNTAMDLFDVLRKPPTLSTSEMDLVNQLSDAFGKQYTRDVVNPQISSSLASLDERGILNSSVARDTFSDIYSKAGQDTASNRVGLLQQALNQKLAKNMDLFGSFFGGSPTSANALSSALSGSSSGLQGLQGLTGQFTQQRMNAFNTNVQNQQAQYLHQQQLYNQDRQRRGSLGGLIGGGLGLAAGIALAPFTGGLSLMGTSLGTLGSAAVGGMLGSGAGRAAFM